MEEQATALGEMLPNGPLHIAYGATYQSANTGLFDWLSQSDRPPQEVIEALLAPPALQAVALPIAGGVGEASPAALHTSARNYLRIYGRPALAMGYPCLAYATPEQTLVVPLLYWPLVLEPQIQGASLWHVGRRDPFVARINPEALPVLMQSREGQVLPAELLEASLHSWQEAREWLSRLLPKQAEALPILPPLHPAPAPESAAYAPQGVSLLFCGTLGVFHAQARTGSPCEAEPPTLVPEEPFFPGIGDLDPDQATALWVGRQGDPVVVQGGAGSGKTYLAAHLASAHLAAGKSCLIVSDTVAPLQQIQSQMDRMGLFRLSSLLQSPVEGLSLLAAAWRAELTSGQAPAPFDAHGFQVLLDKLRRSKEKIDSAYQALRTPILGEERWARLCGRFLQVNAIEGKELLAASLDPADFNFSSAEYDSLMQVLPIGQPLFEAIQGLGHPLRSLHHDLFLHTEKTRAQEIAEQKTRAFEKRCTSLAHRYRSGLSLYADTLRSTLEAQFRQLNLLAQHILDISREGSAAYGKDWLQASPASLKIKAAVSSRARAVAQAREEMLRTASELLAKGSSLHAYGFDPVDKQLPTAFRALPDFVRAYQEQLVQWYQGLSGFVQHEILRLNASNAHAHILPQDLLEELESAMDLMLQELNEARLLERSTGHQLLTLHKRLKLLNELLEQFEELRKNMRDFPGIYNWQRFWLPLPEYAKKVVRSLAHVKPTHWQAAFESWYLDQLLFRSHSLAMPQETPPLGEYRALWQSVQEELPSFMLHTWSEKRYSALRTLVKRIAEQEKQRKTMPADVVIGRAPQAFLNACPLVLATTQTALELFRNVETACFDQLIFLQAEEIAAADAQHLIPLATRCMAIGNPFPPNESGHADRLLPYALARGWQQAPLRFVHRLYGQHPIQLRHPDKISDASGSAASVSDALPGRGTWKALSQTNYEEAERLLAYLLEQLPPKPNRTLPSTAVVTATTAQRNLLADMLLQIKRGGGKDAERIQQLERNGLGVYSVEEPRFPTPEVLLVSLTRENLPEQPGDGCTLRQAYRLIGTATRQTLFFHSLSKAHLEKAGADSAHPASRFIANYLLLLDAAKTTSSIPAELLARFEDLALKYPVPPDQGPLLQYIAKMIGPYFGSRIVAADTRIAHLPLPLSIHFREPADTPDICICPDGFFAETPATDYCWEWQQIERLKEHRIACVPTWSVLWWKQAEQEARRLASRLIYNHT